LILRSLRRDKALHWEAPRSGGEQQPRGAFTPCLSGQHAGALMAPAWSSKLTIMGARRIDRYVNIAGAKARLSELVEKAASREEILIW
jgi:hypothetical protein